MKVFNIEGIRRIVCVLVASVNLTIVQGQNVNYITPYDDNSFYSKTIDLSRTVGSTAGQAGVSSGAATYIIPITTPPRPGGVPAPTLSLNYSSFGEDGALGLGWTIAGVSGIVRVGKIRAHNNITEPICTSQDEFSFDGVKLKKVTGGTSTIEHWNTENESFAEIISYRDNNNRITKWTITTKDGNKYYYGDVDGWYASNSTCENVQCNATNGGYLAYYLDYVEFPNGNMRQYSYVFNNQRERLISEVYDDYGSIKFHYKDRSDKYSVYAAGSRIDKHALLDFIEVKGINNQLVRKYSFKYSTDNINSFLSEVEESTVSNNKLNSTIFQYGLKEASLNFATNMVIQNTRSGVVSHSLETGDYNGDGISDLLVIESKVDYCTQAPCWHTYYSAGFHVRIKDPNSNNFNTMYTSPDLTDVYVEGSNKKDNHRSYFSADFNGDGRDDVLTHHIDYSDQNKPKLISTTIWTSNWNGSNFSQNISYPPSGLMSSGNYSFNELDKGLPSFYYTGDFDGDGVQDIVYKLWSGLYISYPNRNIYFREIDATLIDYTNCNSQTLLGLSNLHFEGESVNAIDFDGDNRSELAFFWNWTNSSNGNKGSTCDILKIIDDNLLQTTKIEVKISHTYNEQRFNYFYGDFNGDKLTDILYKTTEGESKDWKIGYSTANNFEFKNFTFNNLVKLSGTSWTLDILKVGDFNGDGKSDIAHANYGSSTIKPLQIYYSGNQHYNQFSGTIPGFFLSNSAASSALNAIADFNGDGKLDLIHQNGNWTNFSNGKCCISRTYDIRYFDFSDNKLQKIQNGLGSIASFDYTSMSKISSLNSSYGPQYNSNNMYVKLPLQLVSRFREGNGSVDLSYAYSGAMLNKKGRGFMGFRRLETIDNISGENTYTYLNKSHTFSGFQDAFVVDYVEKKKNGIVLESNRTYFTPILTSGGYTWNVNNTGRLWLKQYKTETSNYFSGNVTTNLIYDDYGNVTNKEVIDPDEYTINESFVYGTNASKRPALPNSSTTTYSKTGLASKSYTTTYEYNTLFQLKKKIEFFGLPKAVTSEYQYNMYGNLTEDKLSANGLAVRKTEYIYNPSNNKFLSEKKNSLGQSTLYFMDTRHNKPGAITGVDGRNTYYSYDAFGILKEEYTYHSNGTPIVNTTNYIWDNSISVDNKNSVYKVKKFSTNSTVSEEFYDMAGRKIAEKNQVFDGTYQLTKYFYNIKNKVYRTQLFDANNQLIKGEDVVYDDYGRVIMRDYLDANGSFTSLESITYNKGSDYWESTTTIPASSSNANGTTRYLKTSLGGKTLESNENGVNTLSYEYNAEGKPTKVISSGVVLNEKQYDAYGRVNKEIDNSAGTETYDYNAFGETISHNTSNNGFKKFEYDILGRKTKEIINEGTITYTYFPTGSGIKTNLIKEIKGYNNINKEVYDYNLDGRISNITKTIAGNPTQTKTITLAHNLTGQLSQRSITGGGTYNYWYNSQGFLHEITKGSQQIYTLMSMTPLGLPKHIKLGGTRNVNYQYDNFNRVTNISSDFVNDNYTWDNINGNLEFKTEINTNSFPTVTPLQYSYVYDNFNRLTEEHLDMWGRPRISNHLQYENNGRIEYNEKVSQFEPYAYHSGKMFAVKNAFLTEPHFSPYTQDIVFSSFNRATKISQQNHELTYVYDQGFDRVFAHQKLNGISQVKRYYFGTSEFNFDAANNLINSIDYIYAGDQLVAMDVTRPSGSDIWYVHEDYQGTIRAVYNSSNQVYYQNFDAWGNYRMNDVLSPNYGQIGYQKPASIPNWLYKGYTGQEHLSEFGLINLNARLYDPHIGRMLSPDILVTDNSLQGYNRYTYCHNNPLKFSDPDGNDPILGAFIVGVGIGLFHNAAMNVIQGRDLLAGDAKSWITAGLVGGISGVMTMGIGTAFGPVGGGAGSALGKVGTEIARAGVHGLLQGMLAPASGGDFMTGFASGTISSALGSGAMMYGGSFGNSTIGGFGVSALSGGIGAELAGGNFWDGARNGLVIHGLNHVSHVNDMLANDGGGGAWEGMSALTAGSSGGIVGLVASIRLHLAYRAFIAGNFRHNLILLTGVTKEYLSKFNYQAHHVFPQAREFAKFFQRAGINIHDPRYGAWWRATLHQANSASYNAAWRQWILKNPTANSYQIKQYGREIMAEYGFKYVNF